MAAVAAALNTFASNIASPSSEVGFKAYIPALDPLLLEYRR
jgi:hypothetical protein